MVFIQNRFILRALIGVVDYFDEVATIGVDSALVFCYDYKVKQKKDREACPISVSIDIDVNGLCRATAGWTVDSHTPLPSKVGGRKDSSGGALLAVDW